jgi:hypothetical protein
MKRFIHLTVSISIAVYMVSCGESILDLEPLNKRGSNVYYESDDNCLKALVSCFRSNNRDFDLWCWGDLTTDDVTKGGYGLPDGIWYFEIAGFTATPVNRQVVNMWKWNFEVITRTNELISRIEEQETISELKRQYAAEARFLRSFSYFKLLVIYGRVPLFDRVLIPSDFSNVRRAKTEKEVIDFIKMDLDKAIPNLPVKGSVETGHITKGAARALKARVCMYETGYHYNPVMKARAPEFTGSNVEDLWEEIYRQTDTVIRSGYYELLPNYAIIHEETGENSTETVYELQYITDPSIPDAQFPSNTLQSRNGVRGYQGWGFNLPKDNLYHEFSRNGDKDPRRECTMLSEEWPAGWGINIVDSIMMGTSRSQYQWNLENPDYDYSIFKSPRKGVVSKEEIYQWNANPYNLRVIRYADVLLMNAEAAYHSGDQQRARDRVNKVRERAANSTYPRGAFPGDVDENNIPVGYRDFPDANLPPVVSSGYDLLEDIWHERRVELALENLRYLDLIRTGRIEKLAYPDAYKSKKGLWPIPDRDVTSWGLEQNEGY